MEAVAELPKTGTSKNVPPTQSVSCKDFFAWIVLENRARPSFATASVRRPSGSGRGAALRAASLLTVRFPGERKDTSFSLWLGLLAVVVAHPRGPFRERDHSAPAFLVLEPLPGHHHLPHPLLLGKSWSGTRQAACQPEMAPCTSCLGAARTSLYSGPRTKTASERWLRAVPGIGRIVQRVPATCRCAGPLRARLPEGKERGPSPPGHQKQDHAPLDDLDENR